MKKKLINNDEKRLWSTLQQSTKKILKEAEKIV